MDLSKLEILKEMVATSKDLASAPDYFMDHFGENEEFLDLGGPSPQPMLEGLIAAVGRQMFGARTKATQFLLIRVPGTTLVHGVCRIDGRPTSVLYFDDIQVGILAVPQGVSGRVQYSRFSAERLPPDAAPSKN